MQVYSKIYSTFSKNSFHSKIRPLIIMYPINRQNAEPCLFEKVRRWQYASERNKVKKNYRRHGTNHSQQRISSHFKKTVLINE